MAVFTREFFRTKDPVTGAEQWFQLEFDATANELSVVSSYQLENTIHSRRFVDEFFSDDRPQAAKDALRSLLIDFIGRDADAKRP